MRYGLIKKPAFVRNDSRGLFNELINQGDWHSLIYGTMNRGAKMGHHYHHHTILYFYLISGQAKIRTLNLKTHQISQTVLKSGQAYIFKPEEVRIIHYQQKSQFIIMKNIAYDPKDPDLIDYPAEF